MTSDIPLDTKTLRITICKEEHSVDQYRSRLKLSENFHRHWSIRISVGKFIWTNHWSIPFSGGNSYGPMVLKVLLKFPPALALVGKGVFLPKKRRFFAKKGVFLPKRILTAEPRNSYRQTLDFFCPKFGQNGVQKTARRFFAKLLGNIGLRAGLQGFFEWGSTPPFPPFFSSRPSFAHLSPPPLPPPRFSPFLFSTFPPSLVIFTPFFLLPASFPPLLLPSCSLLHPSLPFFPLFFSPVPCRRVKQVQCGKLAFLGFS